MKANDDIIGVLGWLAPGLVYGWSVWKLNRPHRDTPVSGSSADTSKVVELRVRRADGREPGTESAADLGAGKRSAA